MWMDQWTKQTNQPWWRNWKRTQRKSNLMMWMLTSLMQCSSCVLFPTYLEQAILQHACKLAQAILQHACKLAEEVHIILICDTNTGRPSIKALEWSAHGDSHSNYSITGPNQQRPVDFNTAFLSSSFKTALMEFIGDEWASDKYVNIIRGHTLYFATGEVCHRYHVANDAVV